MSVDRAPEGLVNAWQQQTAGGFRLVPSDVAGMIRADVRRARRWFTIGAVFFVVAFILFGTLLSSQTDPMRRFAHVVMFAGIVFFAAQFVILWQRVRAARFDVDRTTAPSLSSARRYLEIRRAFQSGSKVWIRLAVLFPGVPIDIYAQVRAGIISTDAGVRALLMWVGLLAVIVTVERVTTRRYDRALRELDDIEHGSPVERFMSKHEQWSKD